MVIFWFGQWGGALYGNIAEIKEFLKNRLSKKRYVHSLNVADECFKLAEKYEQDKEKLYFAGLLHDVCKEQPFAEQREMTVNSGLDVETAEITSKPLWHAVAGAVFVRDEMGINDKDIINSIRFHTIAHAGMTRFEEIVYLGDLVSADRDYKDVERMRKLAYTDIDRAMLEALKYSIETTMKKNGYVPHYTVEAYNQYVYVCEQS